MELFIRSSLITIVVVLFSKSSSEKVLPDTISGSNLRLTAYTPKIFMSVSLSSTIAVFCFSKKFNMSTSNILFFIILSLHSPTEKA